MPPFTSWESVCRKALHILKSHNIEVSVVQLCLVDNVHMHAVFIAHVWLTVDYTVYQTAGGVGKGVGEYEESLLHHYAYPCSRLFNKLLAIHFELRG